MSQYLQTKLYLFLILTLILGLSISGCNKDELKPGMFEAEGYIIGYHPCVQDATVNTSHGRGEGYVIATTDVKPDTLMIFGVPEDMFDVSNDVLSQEGQREYKMRFTYQLSTEDITSEYICLAFHYLPPYLEPEYVLLDGERIE